jgi:uncharacterized membrane protein
MWLVFASLARAFWAAANAFDQVLARAHPRHRALAAVLLERLSYFPYALILYFFFGPFPYNPKLLIFSFAATLCAVLGSAPYYIALRHEHAHNVTPYLEFTPVFLILLAFLFKDEVLSTAQLAGAIIVIVGGFLFSWDFARSHFKIRIFVLLALASLLFAFYQYYASQAGLYGSIAAVACYYYFFSGLLGLVPFVVLKDVRKTIVKTFVQTKGNTFFIALSSDLMGLLAFVSLLLAFRLAPTLGHVAGLSGSQPIFSFALAIPLAKFFPKHFSKIIFDREALAKISLVALIAFGVYLLAAA